MHRDILAFPASAIPDRAVAALPMLHALRDSLRDSPRAAPKPRRTEAPLFFFRPELQSELPPPAADPLAGAIAAVEALLTHAEVRHAARAIPGLTEAVARTPAAAGVAARLAIPDDEVVLVLHPAGGIGWRVLTRGIAAIGQFQELFNDTAAAPFSGPRVRVASPRLIRPHALQPDGSWPVGWAGADFWLWPQQSLAAIDRVDGERVVGLCDPVGPAEWDVDPRFPEIPASLELIERLSTAAVDDWLRGWCGAAPTRPAMPALSWAA